MGVSVNCACALRRACIRISNSFSNVLKRMATQNVVPSVHSGSRKGGDALQSCLKEGQSVSKRLQQDLMTLMVKTETCSLPFPHFVACIFLSIDGGRPKCHGFPGRRQPVSLGGHSCWRERHRIRGTQIQTLSHFSVSISLHSSYCQVSHALLPSQRRRTGQHLPRHSQGTFTSRLWCLACLAVYPIVYNVVA